MSTLGMRIKEIRGELHLTQQQFAESISVSRPFISRVEADKEKPSDSLLKLISATYHIKIEWLKFGLGDKKQILPPYKEFQMEFMNSETLNLLISAGNKKNTSFCLSVLMSILQNPNIKGNSDQYYMEQIKMLLVCIDSYLKNFILLEDSYNFSLFEEDEFKIKIRKEFLQNIERYIDEAVRCLEVGDLNDTDDE